MTDTDYMQCALKLAIRGKGRTSPNPLVGAVVVKNRRIIGEGWHRKCGGPHAEVVALKKAGPLAEGADLYVTLEPCSHFGRTPPCVDQIIKKGIRKVVIGMKDPNPDVNGKSIVKLKRAGIKTKKGVLEKELKKINEGFIKYKTTMMPFVVAKSAQTLDGKIATASGQSKWITSKRTRDYAHKLRNEFDAILVGINTVLKDNPHLNATRRTKRIRKIIVDTTLKIPLNANLFKNIIPADCFVATTKRAKGEKINFLRQKGVYVLICPESKGKINLKWLFKQLAKKEIMSILIEGGSRIIGSALKQELIDKMWLFISPKIIGDNEALSSITGLKTYDVGKSLPLKDLTIKTIDRDIFIEGYVH